jgi:hypothetical protein
MICNSLYSYCVHYFFSKRVLLDITNLPAESVKTEDKSSTQTLSKRKKLGKKTIKEVDCQIIASPPGFGLFDLGINRALNEQSPLYQQLSSSAKVGNYSL